MKTTFKPVPRPSRTVLSRQNDIDKVYLTLKVEYSKEKKRSVPKRVYIGKLNDDGMLVPNRNYFDYFGEESLLIDPPERCDCISVGPYLAFSKIAQKEQLDVMLSAVFDDDNANKILDIASYMVVSESNKMQYFEHYGYDHALFSSDVFSDSTISNILQNLKIKDIDTFLLAWVNSHIQDTIYIAYDSTNMNCEAGNIELVEYGHAKDCNDLPIVNLSLAYDQTNQKPLFYEIYPGSLVDNTECRKMVERADRYGCKSVGFILDRGYFSKQNIRYFEGYGYDYIVMAKGNASFIQRVIDESGAQVKNGYSGYLEGYEIYGVSVEKDLFGTGKKEYVHLYYDGVRAENEKIEINKRFNRMENNLKERVKKKLNRKEDVIEYEKYYQLKFDDNGYFKSYKRKDRVIRQLVDKAGYFVIITSKKMNAREALEIYRDRDAIEKVFRMDKSYLGNDVFRVHDTQRLESKVFISFIAMILRNEIYHSMKGLYKKNRKEYTVPNVLRELDKLRITKLADGKYHIRYNLTNKQKAILKEINGITEKEYMIFVEDIIASLK